MYCGDSSVGSSFFRSVAINTRREATSLSQLQKLVPLQEELALLNDYFTIQQYRYGGDLEIEVSRIESETLCRDCMIPRFTLQPLVENAIFHGLEPKGVTSANSSFSFFS